MKIINALINIEDLFLTLKNLKGNWLLKILAATITIMYSGGHKNTQKQKVQPQ